MSTQDQRRSSGELPPLAPPDASDDERGAAIEARLMARKGGTPALEDYRRGYEVMGLSWPGDDEIRRRHPTSGSAA